MSYRRGSLDRDVYAARDLSDRVRRAENKRSVSVGPWSIDVDRATGNLIATHRPTGEIHVLAELDQPHPLAAHPEPEQLPR